MKTPEDFNKKVKAGVITDDILAACLYSVNKRAKNARDKQNECNWYNDRYGNYEKLQEKKEYYYSLKEQLLNLSNKYPSCIHKVSRTGRERIYDYDDEYDSISEDKVINRSSYFDHEELCIIHFADIKKTITEYYLLYDFGEYSFHQPISTHDIEKTANRYKLQIIDLEDLTTKGKDIAVLVSVQFVRKVLGLLEAQAAKHG